MLAFMNDLFASETGLMVAGMLVLVGLSDIAIATLLFRKRIATQEGAQKQAAKTVYITVLVAGFVFAAIGFHGLDVHFGIFQ